MGKRKLILTLGVIAVGIQSAMAASNNARTSTQTLRNFDGKEFSSASEHPKSVTEHDHTPEKGAADLAGQDPQREDGDKRLEEAQAKIRELEQKLQKQKAEKADKTPFDKTTRAVVGAIGVGLGGAGFLASEFGLKNAFGDNGDVTEALGYTGEEAEPYDLHDVMFAGGEGADKVNPHLSALDGVEVSSVDVNALQGYVFAYIMLGAVCVCLGLILLSMVTLNNNHYVTVGSAIGVLVGAATIAGGFALNFDISLGDNAKNFVWSDQILIWAGVAILALAILAPLAVFLKNRYCAGKPNAVAMVDGPQRV